MGKTNKSGLSFGIGSSPQMTIMQGKYDGKIKELIENELSLFDSSKFDYNASLDKYENYLLNLDHKIGGSKAKFLKDVLGYENGDSEKLHNEISRAINGKIPSFIEKTKYGIKHNYKVELNGKDGNNHTANVTVVIQNDNGKVIWRLITLTPDKKSKKED